MAVKLGKRRSEKEQGCDNRLFRAIYGNFLRIFIASGRARSVIWAA
jgi:hypothetical protein